MKILGCLTRGTKVFHPSKHKFKRASMNSAASEAKGRTQLRARRILARRSRQPAQRSEHGAATLSTADKMSLTRNAKPLRRAASFIRHWRGSLIPCVAPVCIRQAVLRLRCLAGRPASHSAKQHAVFFELMRLRRTNGDACATRPPCHQCS
jgi:hypothetical protein